MELASILGMTKILGCAGIIAVIIGAITFIYKKGKDTGKQEKQEQLNEQMEVRLIELTKELNNLVDNPNSPLRVSKPKGNWGEIRKT